MSAVSTAMKGYHLGKSPKPTKTDKHQARLAGRVVHRLSAGVKLSARRMLCALLAASVLFLGIAQGTAGAGTSHKDQVEQTALSGAKALDLNAKLPTQQEMYESYMQQGREYSQKEGDENRQKAIEYFAKAINEIGVQKALSRKTSLDEKTEKIYSNVLRAAQFSKMMAEEKEKSKKSNSWLYWAGGAAAAAGLGYLIYTLTKKDDEPQPPPSHPGRDYKVDLVFKVINATEGVLVNEHKIPQVRTSTDVTVSISELKSTYGLTGVDDNRIIVRGPLDNCEFVDFERDGDSTFKVDRDKHKTYNFNYTIFLLPTQTSQNEYDKLDEWIDKGYGKLYFTPSWTYHRQDENGATGPQEPIDRAVNEFNQTIDHSWMKYGKLTKIESAGNMYLGYLFRNPPILGYHSNGPPPVALINANTVHDNVMRTRICKSEFNELDGSFDNLNPYDSYSYLTDSSGNYTKHGIQFLNYLFAKDTQKIGVASSDSSSNAALQSPGGVNARIGGVDVGFSGNRLSAGYQGKNVGLSTELGLEDKGLSANTTASFSGKGFNTLLIARLSPGEDYFASELNASLGKKNDPVDVGVRGSYATFSGDNSFGFSLRKEGIGVSFDRSTIGDNVTSSAALQTSFNIGEKNALSLSGAVVDSSGAVKRNSLAVGANANLDGLVKGLNISAGYGKNAYGLINASTAYIGVAQRIGPGLINLSLLSNDGKIFNYALSFGFSKAF